MKETLMSTSEWQENIKWQETQLKLEAKTITAHVVGRIASPQIGMLKSHPPALQDITILGDSLERDD